ncbi:MAG: rod shape determining protein RodA [Pseudoalteromonas tetraodonis]|jgi:rod shape determining protein RodA
MAEEFSSRDANQGWATGVFRKVHLDLMLLVGLLLLAAFGLAILSSAGELDTSLMVRQLVRLGLAFGVLFVVAQIPIDILKDYAPHLYIIGVVLLILVPIVGVSGGGAQRWLDLGVFRFQPSEIMKLILPLTVAWFINEKTLPLNFRNTSMALAIVLVPTVLILKQPDLGTSLLVASSGLFTLFISGLRWRWMLAGLAFFAAAAPVLWYFLEPYQRTRILTLLDPAADRFGAGYHIIQSKIAIGSGGVFGKGWLNGTQSHLDFLPERQTDFIFAVHAEEQGLMGVLPLLALYLFIIFRGLYIATTARTNYERALSGALSLTFFVYVFVNIGMVSGILPVVGIPLPLVSYGGTSMVTLMAGFGILMSIHTHRKLLAS